MINSLIKISGCSIYSPFFHLVSDDDLPYIKHLYRYYNKEDFIKGLDLLLKYFKPADIEDINNIIINKKYISKPVLFLSFDDGLKQNYDIIIPILESKGIPATFFINSDFIDNKSLFHRFKASLLIEKQLICGSERREYIRSKHGISVSLESFISSITYNERHFLDILAEDLEINFTDFLKEHRPYLTKIEVSDMARRGFTIGAHSHDHPEFYAISPEQQIQQIDKSVEFVTSLVHQKIMSFSFPFTDHEVNNNVFNHLHSKVSLSFGTAGLKKDELQHHLQRIPFENNLSFNEQIKSSLLKSIARSLMFSNTVKHPHV